MDNNFNVLIVLIIWYISERHVDNLVLKYNIDSINRRKINIYQSDYRIKQQNHFISNFTADIYLTPAPLRRIGWME